VVYYSGAFLDQLNNYALFNIVTCMGCAWLLDGFWIGLLDLLTLYTINYGLHVITALSLLYTLHSLTCTRILSFHLSYPGNGFLKVSLSLQITHGFFFVPLSSFLAIIVQMPVPKTRLNSIPLHPSSFPDRLASRNSTNSSQLKSSL
jgi:hypothetical protein